MSRDLPRVVAAGFLAAFLTFGVSTLHAQPKQDPPPKPEPVVIKLAAAQKAKVGGQDVLVVTGLDPLSGKQRAFAVENQRPQNPNDPPKYDPNPGIKEEIDKVKAGEYLKIEPKGQARANYGGGGYGRPAASGAVEWIADAEPYMVAEHEEEPGTFLFDGGYLDDLEGGEVYKIELIKMGRTFVCLAPMIRDESKKLVPDPAIVAIGDKLKEQIKGSRDGKNKPLVEATINPQGNYLFVTAVDDYQAPRPATMVKVTEADLDGNKVPAVELSESGSAVTLIIPGKMVGKRWVADSSLLTAAKRLKPEAAVVFKTRDVDGKQYIRALAPAPKAAVKKDEMKK